MKTIGNLLLTLGTIVASLAAANSQRASRWLDLAGETTGEYLYADIEVGGATLAAGTPLDTAVVDRLRGAGEERVLVRTPPETSRRARVSDADDVVGAVLAEAATGADGETTFAADTYVDEPFHARLVEAGVEEVALQVPREFRFDAWGQKWYFAIGVLLMVAGVLVKRAAAGGAADEASASGDTSGTRSGTLDRLVARVAELSTRAAQLDGEGIKAAIDPLLENEVPDFVEARDEVRRVHGAGVFAAVYGAFANGERKLSRAWSAAVDGVPEESRTSLALAAEYFRAAREALPR